MRFKDIIILYFPFFIIFSLLYIKTFIYKLKLLYIKYIKYNVHYLLLYLFIIK
jgi:hypothetical protein